MEVSKFIKDTRYLLETELIAMIRDRNIEEILHMVSNVKYFYNIYGPPLPYMRSWRISRKARPRIDMDDGIKKQTKKQHMTWDMIYWLGSTHIVSIILSSYLPISIPTGITINMQGRAVVDHTNLLETGF